MKAFRKRDGWLFPLVGGPWGKRKSSTGRDVTAVTLRLPYLGPKDPEGSEYERLPDEVYVGMFDGGKYVRRPKLKKDGTQHLATRLKGEQLPAFEYAWVTDE